MARSKSKIVQADSWNIAGLVNNNHPMSQWAERRIEGILSAELTEEVRKHVGTNLLGLDMSEDGSRKEVNDWLQNPANSENLETIRSELRAEAQSKFESGEYGQGTRGPQADPPRVAALWPFLVELNHKAGNHNFGEGSTRDQRITYVAAFEGNPKYCGPRGRYKEQVEQLTAHIRVPPATLELSGDL
jgi:hypothetical protein